LAEVIRTHPDTSEANIQKDNSTLRNITSSVINDAA